MKRKLTRNERLAINDALQRQAEVFEKRAEKLMARKREISPDRGSDDITTAEDKLDDAVRKRAASLMKHARDLNNLGVFVADNKVTVSCIIILPEQL